MESTGVYWIALYEVLESRGFRVCVVNARQAKNLPGRKTDVKDCQWLQQLHTYGLLTASFRPKGEIIILRRYLRHRETLVQEAATCIQRIQKALTEMNLQLANVISDISGTTGLRILHAIVDGERDSQCLAAMRDWRIKATPDEVAKSLLGNWRDELIFVLGENLVLFEVYQQKIERCDYRIEQHLKSMSAQVDNNTNPLPKPRKGKRPHGNSPSFDLRSELYRVTGTDLTQIDGINVVTAQAILAGTGTDMSAWKTEKHFVSWLGLCPDHRISGGKVLQRATRKVTSRAATAFRLAASSLRRSQSALGAKYRRLQSRLGAPKAITAMAHFPNSCFFDCMVSHVFRYQKGVLTDLGTLVPGFSSGATQINARGWIAGQSQNGEIDPLSGFPVTVAVLWKANQIIALGSLGGNESVPTGLNNAGQVVGAAANPTLDPFSLFGIGTETRAFLWQNGVIEDLGTLGGPDAAALAVNEFGQVAGFSYTDATPTPVTGMPTTHRAPG